MTRLVLHKTTPLVVVLALLMASCHPFLLVVHPASPARVDQMTAVSAGAATSTAPEALRQNIAINEISIAVDVEPNALYPLSTPQVSSAAFERALEESLRGANLLQSNRQEGRFTLTAHLGGTVQSIGGPQIFSTATATVTYVLLERGGPAS